MATRATVATDNRMPSHLVRFDSWDWAGARTPGCQCGATCTVPTMCEHAAWRQARRQWMKQHGRRSELLAEFAEHVAEQEELRRQLRGETK